MDVLKQTLYWSGNPTEAFSDLGGTGGFVARSITAAESHDASDATYEEIFGEGDHEFLPPDVMVTLDHALQTASAAGAISFVRIAGRCEVIRDAGAGAFFGRFRPRINGVNRGSDDTGLASSFAEFHQDFATDPADAGAWTNAKVNAQTFGVKLECNSIDVDTSVLERLSEYRVELWGPDDVQATPPAGSLTTTAVLPVALVAALLVAGSVSCTGTLPTAAALATPPSCSVTASSTAPLATNGLILPPSTSVGWQGQDPTTDTRSFEEFGVLSVATLSHAPMRPTAPTLLGDASFGTGYSDGPEAGASFTFEAITASAFVSPVDYGSIESIRLFAHGRILAQAGDPTITNRRMKYTAAGQTRYTPATGWGVAYAPGTATFDLSTDPITTQPNGQPWTWSVLAAISNVGPVIDVTDLAFPGLTNETREIWIEVAGIENRNSGLRPIRFDLRIPPLHRFNVGIGFRPHALRVPGPRKVALTLAQEN